MLKPNEKQFTKTVDKIGTFTFNFPNLVDELKADAIASKLLAGNETPTVMAGNIATMMGTLSVAIVESPESFDLDNIYSYDELQAVYDVYTEQVLAFRGESALSKQSGNKETGTEEG